MTNENQDIIKTNDITATPDAPDTPGTPLIELKPEKEDIPDEVSNNIINVSKKEKETITVGKKFEKQKDYTTLKKVIRIVFKVLFIINESFPLAVIILEVVLKVVNNCEFIGTSIYELFIYGIYTIMVISFSFCPGEIDDKDICWALFGIILVQVIAFYPGISVYFCDTTSHLEGFMKSLFKFKIISVFISIGNDIIFGIIFGCVKMICHFSFL